MRKDSKLKHNINALTICIRSTYLAPFLLKRIKKALYQKGKKETKVVVERVMNRGKIVSRERREREREMMMIMMCAYNNTWKRQHTQTQRLMSDRNVEMHFEERGVGGEREIV